MEKERSTKVVAVLALIIAVIGLTVGYAAYTRSLDITDLQGTVNPGDSELDVFFDNDTTKDNALAVVRGEGTAVLPTETGAEITNPVLNSGGNPTITGFRAKFTAKNQTVTYKFYVYNNSPYNAYLTGASFTGTAPHKTCAALDGVTANADVIANACQDITLSLKVGDETILSTGNASFASHTIQAGEWKEVFVTMAYDGTQYPLPDGDMSVAFDGIQLSYSTIAQ